MCFAPALQVLCGDLGESPLEVLSAFSSEVALPLLHTLVQHGAWPDATALEVTDTIQNFAAGGKYQATFPE